MIFSNRMKFWFLIAVIFSLITLIQAPMVHSQYWTALPPYNTLWPLWSPLLSPINSATGLAAPIVNSLGSSMVLPVQPGITWNPALAYPWLLYNTPLGMVYFDAMYGMNTWPPISLIDTMTGLPTPITLPADFSSLPPTSSLWLSTNVPIGNSLYQTSYPYYAYLATLSLTNPLFLPNITPLNIASTLTMLPVTLINPGVVIPPVLSAAALL